MITWITPVLGTAPFDAVAGETGCTIVDVRDLVDRAGNLPSTIIDKIAQAIQLMHAGEKVVIACDYGLSRSNAVAAGVLARTQHIPLREAVDVVIARVGHTAISVDVLSAVRRAVEGDATRTLAPAAQAARRVLVTGSAGFIGSHVTPALERAHTVTRPPRSALDLMHGAIDLDFLVQEHGIDVVLHLASPRVYSTTAALGETLVMLEHVLDVCRNHACRLVTLSSWEIYAGRPEATLASEDTPPLPRSVYGRTKLLCEALIDMHTRASGLDVAVIRACPVYGPGSDKPKFLHTFVDKALRGEDIVTHRYENGLPTLDLMHVDDAASAVRAVVASPLRGYVNIGTGKSFSTADIAAIVRDAVRSRSRITQRDIAGIAPNVAMDYRRAEKLVGWRPTIALSEGIERMLEQAHPS